MLDGVLDVVVHVAHPLVVVRVELPALEAELDVRISDNGLDLEALDACPHLLGGGLAEPNVTLDAGSGRLTPQIKKPSLSLDRAGWMWYTVYITPDGGFPCLSVD